MTDFFRPATMDEALDLLSDNPDAMCLSGGTDLMVGLRAGKFQPDVIVDLGRLGLDAIDILADKVRIGATVTMSRLSGLADTVPRLGLLGQAAATVGAWQIQNRATIGGNLCNASPAADAVCALLALDAEVELARRSETRTVALRDFLLGPGKTDRKPDEILTAVIVPTPEEDSDAYGSYRKEGSRNAMVIAVASVAGLTRISGGKVRHCALALGSVAPTTIRAKTAESFVVGKELSDDVVAQAARLARDDATPIDDLRASAVYRRDVIEALVTEHLIEARQARAQDERSGGQA